jgi:glycosyltransferase involved in cell wall biosynthesis
VIGAGPDESAFDALAAALGIAARVVRLGFVPHHEIASRLSAFDLFVLPSETRPHWKEQFGRVLIEALACGVPVVGSDSGSIPEIVRATGGGLVFAEGNADALAAALHSLIEAPAQRRAYADAGGARARALYSQSAVAGRMAQAIAAALPASGTRITT